MPTQFSTATQGKNAVEGAGTNGATGVQGISDTGNGVIGTTASTSASGVLGQNTSGTGVSGTSSTGIGVSGTSQSSGTGVSGTSSTGIGVSGTSQSSIGLLGSGGTLGVQGTTPSASATDSGVAGHNTGNGPGVSGFGDNTTSTPNNYGMYANSINSYGMYATSNTNSAAYFEITNAANTQAVLQVITEGGGTGIFCKTDGIGIEGNSTGNAGVQGISKAGEGVYGHSDSDVGVYGESITGTGVEGRSASGLAGKFFGNVDVQGTLTKTALQFRIDHPHDPTRKYLSHASVESSEMKNMYDGVVVLDDSGEGCVELPCWFEALNRDFRYQLTCVGGYAPVYIAEEIHNQRFRIAGGKAGMKVCWMVTGIRHDVYAQAHPLIVEQEKEEQELDSYRHPELYVLQQINKGL